MRCLLKAILFFDGNSIVSGGSFWYPYIEEEEEGAAGGKEEAELELTLKMVFF